MDCHPRSAWQGGALTGLPRTLENAAARPSTVSICATRSSACAAASRAGHQGRPTLVCRLGATCC